MEVIAKKSWWNRYWLWVVIPLAALGVITSWVGIFAVIISSVFGLLKSTDAYQQGMSRARSDPVVIEALGLPIKDGWFLTGSVEVNAQSGTADLQIPVSGPKGAGTIYVAGTKIAGVWTYSRLNIKLDGSGQTVELSAASQ